MAYRFTKKATAPYNFVSLPKKVLPSEIKSVADFKKHIETRGNLSGEIELKIETLTPLFLGGNSIAEKSFSPAGKFIIPGSSLRGMFKNIFKIAICGAFRGRTASQQKGEDFNDEKIYFRCLMKNKQVEWDENYNWSADLNKIYSDRMQSVSTKFEGKKKTRIVKKKAIAGFLIKKNNGEYWIAPLQENCSEGNWKITDEIFNNRSGSCVIRQDDKFFTFTGTGNKKKYVRYTEITDVNFDKKSWLKVPDEVLTSYEHDRNRKGVNLLEDAENKKADEGITPRAQLEKLFKQKKLNSKLLVGIESIVPCHFLKKDGEISAFGHGQYFRIPYENSIGDIVPAELQSEEIIDFSDAVFGRKENWASRVCFEDAAPISEIKTLVEKATAAHPLMQPNPTSYQLYLKQEDGAPLKFWEQTGIEIRGYKMYWHNKDIDWLANEGEKKLDAGKPPEKRLTKDLTPLKAGATFKSKIRFENLSAVELGALMLTLGFKTYRIGMGKPFGFGSIKITPKLFLENGDAYSAEIFDSKGFKIPYKAADAQTYIKVFKDYLKGKFDVKSWENTIDELDAILDWAKKPAPKKIEQMKSTYDAQNNKMNVDEKFKMRAPLQSIFEVVK